MSHIWVICGITNTIYGIRDTTYGSYMWHSLYEPYVYMHKNAKNEHTYMIFSFTYDPYMRFVKPIYGPHMEFENKSPKTIYGFWFFHIWPIWGPHGSHIWNLRIWELTRIKFSKTIYGNFKIIYESYMAHIWLIYGIWWFSRFS